MKTALKIFAGTLALLLFTAGCSHVEPEFVLPEHPTVRSSVTAPDKDFFTGAELLALNGIAQDDVRAVALQVWFEDGSEGNLLLTQRKAIKNVYQTFEDAEIAWDIVLNTNPSTGEQLDMDWHLSDGTILRFYMRFTLGIDGIDDSFLFSSGASQDDFIQLYNKYRTK